MRRLTREMEEREPLDGVDRLSRRRFLRDMGGWSMGLLLAGVGGHLAMAETGDEAFEPPGFTRPPLAGACLEPVGDMEKTLAAVVDAVVPGPAMDPDGEPGALESCAMNLLGDDFYPFRDSARVIVTLMDHLARQDFGGSFVEITFEQRLAVLVKSQETLPVLRLAYRAIRSAFYGGAYNGVGLDYLGYPGPNLGYRHLEQASFRRPVCEEMTETGWMP